ncbi:hypothetical protein B0H67DRAFT_58143 [Lasiosphaeris hirsuta]|uniref:Uncharacterized protein n=1 Tax=Lasiosphaeris hirsuta TaxID=260670 RepID=A0AA40BBG7_9PEZI|nr:hypothetical protein B0H67DRAFT_58143 [Lasiosphaeris hirsuta]
MAVGLDGLEKGLDRLEKFFSKKKRASGRDSVTSDSSPTSPAALTAKSALDPQTFPEPSFIRPTSTRMRARDEVHLTSRLYQRAHSLPEAPSTPRSASLTSTSLSSNEAKSTPASSVFDVVPVLGPPVLDSPPRIPKRSSSLSPACRSGSLASLAELLEFSFANTASQHGGNLMSRRAHSRSGSVSPRAKPCRKHQSDPFQEREPAFQHYHLDTPPPSAQQEKSFASLQLVHAKGLPTLPPRNESTPNPSPRLIPVPEPNFEEVEIELTFELRRAKSLDIPLMVSKDAVAVLRKAVSLSALEGLKAPLKASSKTTPVLKEPSFRDFMSLSDDDIADVNDQPPMAELGAVPTPPSCALPPDPPILATSPQISSGVRLLTLSPPLATRPATAAAFEAARIAQRYRFDLVYVVNLWPSHLGCSPNQSATNSYSSVPPATHGGNIVNELSPLSDTPRRVRITGRLLAAYGLPAIMSPFRISTPVHQKVLRSEDWLEYRCETATIEEFSRGYSCSFYTGHSPENRPVEPGCSEGKMRKRKGKAPNRGVVFAAYRLPRPNGSDNGSDTNELEALRRDAETLVDMLMERRPTATVTATASKGYLVSETGPLPIPSNPLLAI